MIVIAIFQTVTSAGQVWMDRNIGAFRVAQSEDDYQAYGGCINGAGLLMDMRFAPVLQPQPLVAVIYPAMAIL